MAKKKEKILTVAELKEKIKKEKADFWIHSEPQLSLIQTQEGLKIFPISDSVEKQITLIFLMEASDYFTDRILELIETWKKRYASLGWKPILVFQQKYTFIMHKRFLERYKGFACFESLPLYLDTFGELYEWGGAKDTPTILLLNQGNLIFKAPLFPDYDHQIQELEGKLQEALRLEDPGLPLPLIHEYKISGLIDKKTFYPKDVTLGGQWLEGQGTFMTDDIRATLTFNFTGKSFRFICSLHTQARDNSRIVIKFNQSSISERFCGKNIKLDEKKNTVIEINTSTGIYEVFKSDDEMSGVFEFIFKNAFESPIIFHEIKVA